MCPSNRIGLQMACCQPRAPTAFYSPEILFYFCFRFSILLGLEKRIRVCSAAGSQQGTSLQLGDPRGEFSSLHIKHITTHVLWKNVCSAQVQTRSSVLPKIKVTVRTSGLIYFVDSRLTDSCEVVSLTCWPTFTPRDILCSNFC
jgi:hypothetical protein